MLGSTLCHLCVLDVGERADLGVYWRRGPAQEVGPTTLAGGKKPPPLRQLEDPPSCVCGGESGLRCVRLAETLPNRCWEETPEEYGARLKLCCEAVNAKLDVEGLCWKFPVRVQKLLANEGGRLAE